MPSFHPLFMFKDSIIAGSRSKSTNHIPLLKSLGWVIPFYCHKISTHLKQGLLDILLNYNSPNSQRDVRRQIKLLKGCKASKEVFDKAHKNEVKCRRLPELNILVSGYFYSHLKESNFSTSQTLIYGHLYMCVRCSIQEKV